MSTITRKRFMGLLKHIAIIDCAIKEPSINCFNRIVLEHNFKFSFHLVPQMGIESLKKIKADAYIVFGSYSNVCDRLDWQIELASFIKEQLLNNKPVLGICFGHQLIAELFGAKIEKIKPENPDFAYNGQREVEISKDILGFKKGEKLNIFTSHSYEVKTLPSEFIQIASSSECTIDGLAHTTLPFYSFQGHPEASEHFVKLAINENRKQDLTKEQFLKAQSGGDRIIKGFLNQVYEIN